MIKTTIFVEGQTELIFVRELLLKIFEYQGIALECYNLFTDNSLNATEYSFPNPEAEYFFQIINAGNDQSVLTRILRREIAKDHTINKDLNQNFIDGAKAQIKSKNIFFSFAIMEVEAWLLGLRNIFTRKNEQLTSSFIDEKLGLNLDTINPEEAFFH